MPEGGTTFPSSLSITSFPESGVTTAPANIVYDVASRLYTNTNFDMLEEPLDSYARKCIYRGNVFAQIYDSLKTDEIDG